MRKSLVALLLVSSMLLSSCLNMNPEKEIADMTADTDEVTAETPYESESQEGEKAPDEPQSSDTVVTKDGLRFTSKGNHTCRVSATDDFEQTVLVIPEVSPNGEAVVEIEDDGFAFQDTLIAVTIPKSVKKMGTGAFQFCNNLLYVELSSGIANIPSAAFAVCTSLEVITVPDGVVKISSRAFECCGSLTSIYLPSSVTYVAEDAFLCGDDLISITVDSNNANYHAAGNCLIETKSKTLMIGCKNSVIPDDGSVTSIGTRAFMGRLDLTDLTIPNSITSIGKEAFYNCVGLKSLIIPNSVVTIGESAFFYCQGLTSVTIPSSVTTIGERAFQHCISLTDVTIPNGVKTLEQYAFAGCKELKSLSLPSTLTSIKARAFWECSGLEALTVEDGNGVYHSSGNCLIETASKTVILGCSNSVIPTDGSVTCIGPYAFEQSSDITELVIPQGVLQIGYCAFQSCEALKKVTVANSVTMIDRGAFRSCENLTDIYFQGTLEEWRAIQKAYDWYTYGAETIIIHCTNGQDIAIRDGK